MDLETTLLVFFFFFFLIFLLFIFPKITGQLGLDENIIIVPTIIMPGFGIKSVQSGYNHTIIIKCKQIYL